MNPAFITAAKAYLFVREQGAEIELSDRIASLHSEWFRNADMQYAYRVRHSTPQILADEFESLLHDEVARDAMRIALEHDWPSIAAAEIIAFAKKLHASEQRKGAA